MENDIVNKSIPELVTAGGDAAKGAALVGGAVGLLQNPAAQITADTEALKAAAYTYEVKKADLAARRAVVRELVGTSRSLLIQTRDSLKPILGSSYNESWDITGLVGSLEIPFSAIEIQPLLSSFETYLGNRPALEVEVKDITAPHFAQLANDLNDERAAVRSQEVAVGEARQERDKKARLLRKRLRDLIEELNMRLDPLDLRWKEFGFNMPGAEETPDVPENLTVTLSGTNAALKWKAAPRAEYYHVWKKVVGVDEEPELVGSPTDLAFIFEALPSNSTIELAVSAVNNGGESQLSEVVKIVTQ